MPSALTPLANYTIPASTTFGSLTFSNIPATYRDLRIVWFGINAGGNQDVGFQLNGSNGTSAVYMAGFGSGTGSGTSSDILGYVSAAGMLNQIDIFDYNVTDKHKSGLIRYGDSGNFAAAAAFRWANTAAITSVRLYLGTGGFASGSTFALYGVSA